MKNILWINTDQHLATCLGCMGNSVIQTPNLDKLAAEGVLFEKAFCQSPVCMASRASFLTGRYPEAVRVRGMGVLPPQETTLPEWLQRHGYETGAYGKVHLTPERYTRENLKSDVPILDYKRFADEAAIAPVPDDPLKENYGFKTHIGCDDACRGNYFEWLKQEAPELLEIASDGATRTCANYGEFIREKAERFADAPFDLYVYPATSEHHHTTYIAKQAEAAIRSRKDSDAPWMTFCSFIAPHHPFEAPQDQIDRYAGVEMPLPDQEVGVDMQAPPAVLVGEGTGHGFGEMTQYPEEIQKQIIKHYYASISLIDDCVGRLVAALEETGQRENTIIVFVADHGEHIGSHGLLRKTSVHYDSTLQVPLIMNAKPINTGRRVEGLVELVDIYPTLLGLVGLPINPGVQGLDWSEALLNSKEIGREDIYSDMYEMDPMVYGKLSGPYCACQTLRTPDWKLNVYPTHDLECSQLFDLRNDPDETRNRFHDQECRDVRDAMLWRMMQRLHANVDPLPLRLTQW